MNLNVWRVVIGVKQGSKDIVEAEEIQGINMKLAIGVVQNDTGFKPSGFSAVLKFEMIVEEQALSDIATLLQVS